MQTLVNHHEIQQAAFDYSYRKNKPLINTLLLVTIIGTSFLLPITVKDKFSLMLGRVGIFIPELLMILIITLNRRIANHRLFLWGIFGIFYGLISCFWVRTFDVGVIASLQFYLPILVVSLIPFSDRYIKWLRILITAIFILLCIETILYSLGILYYGGIKLGGERFNEIVRIHTTMGAATAAGAVLFMLLVWCLELWKGVKLIPYALFFMGFFAISITLSRGPFLMVCLMGLVYGGIVLKSRISSFNIKMFLSLLVIFLSIWLMAYTSVGEDILGAFEKRGLKDDRDVRRAAAISVFENYVFTGIGVGQYISPERMQAKGVYGIGLTSPHNTYLLILAEGGVIGIIIFLAGLSTVFFEIVSRRLKSPLTIGLVTILMIGMNVEIFYVDFRYALLLASLFAWGTRPVEHAMVKRNYIR